jgi:hypothetical protein
MAEKEYTPWSRESEDGLITSAVDSHVSVSQNVVPALNVGTIDKLSGKWNGVTVSDSTFLVDATHEAVGNGASVLSPQQSDHEFINMTGFNDLQIAIKPSVTGNYTLTAVQGPDTYAYANLSPVNSTATLRGNGDWYASADFEGLTASTESLAADVWNIFTIINRLSNQKLLQFHITNASGSISNIQFASLRVV